MELGWRQSGSVTTIGRRHRREASSPAGRPTERDGIDGDFRFCLYGYTASVRMGGVSRWLRGNMARRRLRGER